MNRIKNAKNNLENPENLVKIMVQTFFFANFKNKNNHKDDAENPFSKSRHY